MKKRNIIIPIFLLSILAISLASAAIPSFDPRETSEKIVTLLQDFFTPLFNAFLGGEYLFEAILFLAIILAFVYVALSRIDLFYKNKPALWVITICVSVLAARFTLDAQWTQFVLQPYNFLGISILSVVPFIIFFYFLYSFDSETVWAWGWSFYIILYLAMWYTSFDKLGELAWVYLFTGILGLIMILSRKSIWGWRVRQLINAGLNEKVVMEMIRLKKEIDTARESRNNATGDYQKRTLDKKIADLEEKYRTMSRSIK